MEKFSFENLNVYQKSLDFTINICQIAKKFPPGSLSIKDQIIRASLSIPLNIAEGSGRKTDKDKNQFYRTARSSVFEIIPLLEICYKLDLIQKETYDINRSKCVKLSKMLSGLIKY
jgi:four helix bundle protein